jgi:hypothetical protein
MRRFGCCADDGNVDIMRERVEVNWESVASRERRHTAQIHGVSEIAHALGEGAREWFTMGIEK